MVCIIDVGRTQSDGTRNSRGATKCLAHADMYAYRTALAPLHCALSMNEWRTDRYTRGFPSSLRCMCISYTFTWDACRTSFMRSKASFACICEALEFRGPRVKGPLHWGPLPMPIHSDSRGHCASDPGNLMNALIVFCALPTFYVRTVYSLVVFIFLIDRCNLVHQFLRLQNAIK